MIEEYVLFHPVDPSGSSAQHVATLARRLMHSGSLPEHQACVTGGAQSAQPSDLGEIMQTLLTTPRLRLRPFCLADAEELHALFADPLTNTIGSGPFTALS